MSVRLLAGLLVAGALSGCSAQRPSVPGARTPALPGWAVAACASVAGLQAACVGRGPSIASGVYTLVIVRARPAFPFGYVVLRHGADSLGAVVSATGPAGRAAHEFALSPAVRRPVSGWLTAPGRRAFDAGPRRWGGLAGRLFLTRSEGAGEFRDLVAFTWRDGRQQRVIAIGAWGPFAQAVATLRAIVGDRPRAAPAVPELVPAAPAGGIPMVATPRWVRLLCRRYEPRACPAVLPRPGRAFTLAQVAPHSLDVAWGASEHPRPPRLVHLTVGDGPGARGCFGDHICHRWTAHGRRYLVSLHAWRPRRQTRAVFAAVVRSIPA